LQQSIKKSNGGSVKLEIKKIRPESKIPKYAHHGDAGFDLHADLDMGVHLLPGETRVIPTGIAVALPDNHELQVRPRSGLAAKFGITVLNAPGTVDTGYRNEIGVILHNVGHDSFSIKPGDRIAQGVVAPYVRVNFIEVDELSDSERGLSGFGSTGVE
jgi:dUTP pyrophosphatase